MSCPHCHSELPPASRFCPSCGRPSGDAAVATVVADDLTRLSPVPSSSPVRTPSSPQSGWLSSSGSIDHGRFGPGSILDSRYRVLGLLGRGGMGEVYRADDLRLGQQVALKFLPPDLSQDSVRLAQFHNEVRTARQVSHPNVCRVYDIGEIEGQLFITMEYVDGEDLSILLRRIGRLPEDKGLDIARQICAGLAAAHERGVLHRDLKPANIMLDSAGRVRIMDFSLASAGEVTDVRAGTPAYMAPEQLSGREVTVRSDIYALGLVLYEIFTGRRAFDARTLTELIEQHQSGTLTAPTTIVKTLDPAIETAIVRCLDPDPVRRPTSALAASAALPGGDPLAAALAAGETPSPEMIAAVGGDSATMTPAAGLIWLAVTAALLFSIVTIVGRQSLLARMPSPKPAAVLADRAAELRESLGYAEPVADHAAGFFHDDPYLRWAQNQEKGSSRWAQLAAGRPAPIRFWRRTSPRPLLAVNKNTLVSLADPPLLVTGMTATILDTRGRLLRFEAVPPQAEAASSNPPPRVEWSKLFAAAALDPATFVEAVPSRTPATYADERKAWTGTLPETNISVRLEAAGYRGRPVLFEIVAPWTSPPRDQGRGSSPGGSSAVFVYALIAGAVLTAYLSVRRGRADKQGALRLAAFTFFLFLAIWIVNPHVSDVADEQQRLFVNAGIALFVAGVLYVLYLGLEPFVRRSWPTMLVGWSRLLAGRVRDPIIGRDVLVGVALGTVLGLLDLGREALRVPLGLPEPIPHTSDLAPLLGVRPLAAAVLGSVNGGLQNALITVFEFALLRALFEWVTRAGLRWSGRRWTWAARLTLSDEMARRVFVTLAVATVTVMSLTSGGALNLRLLNASYQLIWTTLVLVVLLRLGILASAFMFFTGLVLTRMPLTFDTSATYATGSWIVVALIAGLAAGGFWMARAGEPLVGRSHG